MIRRYAAISVVTAILLGVAGCSDKPKSSLPDLNQPLPKTASSGGGAGPKTPPGATGKAD